MAQVRFLDQVAVTAFATNANQSPNAVRIPRVLQAGESLTIPTNTQGIGYDLYNLGGLITIKGGEQVAGTNIYTHGLLQVETTFQNDGTLVNNGYLVIGVDISGSI
tara:strand:- start:413 stop:730 length:318 start_codon:yes stop_codon:yes gene_type:complete